MGLGFKPRSFWLQSSWSRLVQCLLCLWIVDRLKPGSFLPAWEGGKGLAQLYPPDPFSCPHEGAALRMASSRALNQQWRGSSAGFTRSQTMLREDSAAGPGKFQNLSKSHLGRVLDPELLSHGILMPKTLEASLGVCTLGPCRTRVRPGLPGSLRPELGRGLQHAPSTLP